MFAGVDLGKAYDIPNQLKNSVFFPAICLKVRIKKSFSKQK